MSYQNYEFTAFTEADLLSAGDHNLGCGDTFTMPGEATVCFTVRDNDSTLSGDSKRNENANDKRGQTAEIEGENGQELGNGGQIYAESYHWVCDTDGNWYVMIEIEQEGSNDDYFTFYTGGHYTAPEPGTELTVYSQCNVKGCWVDYKCLDAGEKEATGSISGTVFCDVDCDGINGGVEVIPGCDYTIEAEDMWGWGFKTVHGSQASGGELVKLNCAGGDGLLCTTFNGKEGVYDVKIRVQDENDGQSMIKLKVNGVEVEAIRLDNDSDGGGSNNGGFSTYVIKDVDLSAGDDISIAAWGDGYEFVRIDNIVLEGHDQEVRTEEPVKEGVTIKLIDADTNEVVATTETDADGNYAFDDVPVGNYKIMGVAPDGTEFTIQDAGSDDSIDSDVDSSGTSGVISVTANSETDIDLGLKEEKVEFRPCDDPDAVNIGFEGFAAGVVISDQYDGVTISAQRATNNDAANDAMVFDSNNPTGGDTDLATDAQGNILIISEDNDSSDPDDAIGGEIVFTFDNPSFLYDIKVVDTEEGGTITVVLEDGSTQSFAIPQIGDGDVAQVLMDVDGVVSMTIVLNGSGAIDDLCYVPGEPEPGALSGRYFCDDDRDGLDNDANNAVEGVTVTLLDENGDPVLDDANQPVTTVTDANGDYSFTGLEAGTYGVRFESTPPTKELTTQNVDNNQSDDIDSDAADSGNGTSTITSIVVVAGEENTDNDVGVVYQLGSLSGRYFCDTDGDDVDTVNNSEPGVEGILVTLLDANGNPVLDGGGNAITTTTADDGSYSFGDLVAGTYGVMFTDTSGTNDGKYLVAPNQGSDDSSDSDAIGDATSSVISTIVVTAGQDTPDNDAGIVEFGSLSGRYFCDDDKDGLDNDGQDNGVAGVTVALLDANGDPVLDGNGQPRTTTTDASGNYSFGGLVAGIYAVKFTDAVSGKELTTQNANANANDDIDSDASDLGNGMSEITGIEVMNGQDTPDNDAGVVDPGTASVGDTVWFDADGDGLLNNGETGVDGVTVKLLADLDNDGQIDDVVATAVTANGGQYLFDGLDAGDYAIMFNEPDGFDFTTPGGAADDAVNNDSDAGNGGMTDTFTLDIGEAERDIDAGLVVEDETLAVCADDVGGLPILFGAPATFAVTMVDGQAITPGGSVTTSDGTVVTLESIPFLGTSLRIDGSSETATWAALDIGETAVENISYTYTDGNGTEISADVEVTFKGDANSVQSLFDSLPSGGTYQIVDGRDSNPFSDGGFDIKVTGTGDSRFDDVTFEIAYCLDFSETFLAAGTFADAPLLTADFSGGNDAGVLEPNQISSANGLQASENLDLIQYIIAQNYEADAQYNGWEVQFAIWELTNNFDSDAAFAFDPNFGQLADTDAIIADALANGEGFTPDVGDTVGMIINPNPATAENEQPYIVALNWEDFDCLCIDNSGMIFT
ncbi:MAG: SdrD B-like domain-containing protein [Pseudomonadota bacterium]